MHLPCRAALLDLDDLLVSTKAAWRQAETAALHELGGTYTDADAVALTGLSLRATAEYLREVAGSPVGWEVIAERIRTRLLDTLRHDRHSVELLPGAAALVNGLRAHRLPVVLVTSSDYQIMYHVLARAHLVFDAYVSSAEAAPKPSPEGYEYAAKRAWAVPTECVAIEDSETGVQAAEAAGVRHVIVVPSPGQLIEPAKDRYLVRSLTFVEAEDDGLVVQAAGLVS